MSQARYIIGEREEGIRHVHAYIEKELGLSQDGKASGSLTRGNPDVITLRYGLLSVDDARAISRIAYQSSIGEAKAVIIAAERFFHEAQNALLKLFEEPIATTYLFLIVPTEGMLIPTLRSRMQKLETKNSKLETEDNVAEGFIAAKTAGREKIIAKLLDEAKSDTEEKKQRARADAPPLAEGILRAAYEKRSTMIYHSISPDERQELDDFLKDLDTFIPILYERSPPLKQMFEHLLLSMPRSLVL